MTTPLPDAPATLTLGPEDQVILIFPPHMTDQEVDDAKAALDDKGLTGRALIVSGTENVIVLRATMAEGSTVGQCGDSRWVLDGSPPLTCYLAYGHTGMHSDGEATWSNEGSER